MRSLIVAYLPVLAWMAIIFVASTDIGSSQHTSRIIGPLLRWFYPDVSEGVITAVQAVVRKGGHLSEYAILAILMWRARKVLGQAEWSRRAIFIVIGFCALYAGTDELHQLFVSTRQASVLDVLIDTCGAAAGLLVVWAIGRWRKRRESPHFVLAREQDIT